MSIELKSISKCYSKRDQKILDQASYTFLDNCCTAIVGKSGSGKSTLLNIISGLDKPDSGEIIIDGERVDNMNDAKMASFRAKQIGFVFQFFYLQPFLNITENILIPSYVDTKNPTKEYVNRALELLRLVGLEDKAKAMPNELSGGEIQRVAIARALINHPSIILADEPTGNLDAQNSTNIFALLRQIQRLTKNTLVIVTHDQKVTDIADKIIGIEEGKLVDAHMQ